jgi:protein-disulfide isomerase
MLQKILTGFLIASFCFMTTVYAENQESQQNSFTPQQQKDIGAVVYQYLMDNPDVVMQAAQKVRAKQMEVSQKESKKIIAENMDKLVNSKSPTAGNPKAAVYLVEFLDYNCGYCKRMAPLVNHVVSTNSDVKLIFKNYAVLGPTSQLAAKAALAAGMQNKYQIFHDALIQFKGKLDNETINQLALKNGLDIKQFETDVQSPTVDKELIDNATLAKQIGIQGTPAFIIISAPKDNDKNADTSKIFFLPGALTEKMMQDYINQAKAS